VGLNYSEVSMSDPADTEEKSTIRPGRDFEQEYRLSTEDAGQMLIDLGEQLRDSDELTIEGEEWVLPFAFGEPAEVEFDFEGVGQPELEIEVELVGRTGDDAPDVS
jgi:amphi-Trp domain-containing protein